MVRSFSARLLAATLVIVVLGSCNDKLDLTAPYKENTIVYAVLDADSTIQYVKINKAFLGDGNAFVYAQVPDSTEYTDDQLQAEVRAVKNGVTIATYALHDTVLPHDPGIFAGPMHKLYYFNTDAIGPVKLDSSATYRIDITAKGNSVSAETPVVGWIKPTGAIYSQPLRLVSVGGGYATQIINWKSSVNGKRYEVSYRFHWDEVTPTDTMHRSFDQPLGTFVSNNTAGNESMVAALDGESFFHTVALRVGNDPDVIQRIFRGVDIIWAVAGNDLHTYLQLNSPISGIVEDRPSFTNVTNGYGLFTTRRFREISKSLDANSVPQLVQGQYTAGLLFCVPGSSPPFGCN
jgi:hypothetical protein